ncbi:MAG: DUF4157 domain-containing protein [Desulfobacterales bacterium]
MQDPQRRDQPMRTFAVENVKPLSQRKRSIPRPTARLQQMQVRHILRRMGEPVRLGGEPLEQQAERDERRVSSGALDMAPGPNRVRLHTDTTAAQLATALNARAFTEEEEEEMLRPLAAGSRTSGVAADLEAEIEARRPGGTPLPEASRAFFEPRLGADLNDVRVHADATAARIAERVNARAFTLGRDIFFAEGQYAPETDGGQRLMAHELTHVVQQQRPDDLRKIRRVVRFSADFSNISLTAETGATTQHGHERMAAPAAPELELSEVPGLQRFGSRSGAWNGTGPRGAARTVRRKGKRASGGRRHGQRRGQR